CGGNADPEHEESRRHQLGADEHECDEPPAVVCGEVDQHCLFPTVPKFSLSPDNVGGEGRGEGEAARSAERFRSASVFPPHPTLSPKRAWGRGLIILRAPSALAAAPENSTSPTPRCPRANRAHPSLPSAAA